MRASCCVLLLQVVHTSENLGDHLDFDRVNATAHLEYLGIAAAPGSTLLFTLTQVLQACCRHAIVFERPLRSLS
jgi:hypothetical protein